MVTGQIRRILWDITDTIRINTWQRLVTTLDQEFGIIKAEQVKEAGDLLRLWEKYVGVDENLMMELVKLVKGRQVLIYGDYDADGIISSFMLKRLVAAAGGQAGVYLPDREKDGYGVNLTTLKQLQDQVNFEVLLTIDNGVTADKTLKMIKTKGKKIGIIDHHIKPPKTNVDDLGLVIHSTHTSAGGLMTGLVSWAYKKGLIDQSQWLELVQLGAVAVLADQMSLFGFNYGVVRLALESVRKKGFYNLGINALLKQAGYNKIVNEYTINFIIAPRINATGRIGKASLAFKLLGVRDFGSGVGLAAEIEKLNTKRQQITKEFLMLAEDQIKKIGDFLVFYHPQVPEGILGLLASNLSQKYAKPALVVGGKEKLKGSGRSVGEFDLTNFLRGFEFLFESLGGHKKACGFSLTGKAKLEEVIRELEKVKIKINPARKIKYQIGMSLLNEQLPFEVEKYAPFGNDREKPVFLINKVEIANVYPMGNGSHFKLQLKGAGLVDFVVFGVKEKIKWEKIKGLIVTPSLNHYNGKVYPQFRIIDGV